MRLIVDKGDNQIIGVISDRVTSHLPPSVIGNSTYVDFDYSEENLKDSKLAQFLEKESSSLLGRTLTFNEKEPIFGEIPQKPKAKTVLVDINKPKLHKDCEIYWQKAKDLGAKIKIEDIDSVILAKITREDRVVGTIKLVKKGCCTYVYEEGNVIDRAYYPHYFGFVELINYLKKKVKWLDMGGFTREDIDLNKFKGKWGEVSSVSLE